MQTRKIIKIIHIEHTKTIYVYTSLSADARKEESLKIHEKIIHLKKVERDFTGGPMVNHLPSNAGDTGSIPGWGTKIPHVVGQSSLHTTTTQHMGHNQRAHMPQLQGPHALEPVHQNYRNCTLQRGACAPQWRILHATTNILHAATKTQCSQN